MPIFESDFSYILTKLDHFPEVTDFLAVTGVFATFQKGCVVKGFWWNTFLVAVFFFSWECSVTGPISWCLWENGPLKVHFLTGNQISFHIPFLRPHLVKSEALREIFAFNGQEYANLQITITLSKRCIFVNYSSSIFMYISITWKFSIPLLKFCIFLSKECNPWFTFNQMGT